MGGFFGVLGSVVCFSGHFRGDRSPHFRNVGIRRGTVPSYTCSAGGSRALQQHMFFLFFSRLSQRTVSTSWGLGGRTVFNILCDPQGACKVTKVAVGDTGSCVQLNE